jgi:Tol biopolymer transport system component
MAVASPAATPGRPTVQAGEPWIVYQGGIQLPLRLVRPDGSDDHALLPDSFEGDPGHPAWSPDGGLIAFDVFTPHAATPGSDRVAVWLVKPDGSDAREFAACDLPCLQTAYPAWSPDGAKLALIAYDVQADNTWGPSRLQVLDVATGERRTIAASKDGLTGYYTPRWSPDGVSIVFTIETYSDATEVDTTSSAVAVVPADGSTAPEVVTDLELFGAEPDWAPGADIVLGTGRNKAEDGRLMVVRPDGTGARPLGSFTSGIAIEATWIDGGNRVMFVRGDGGQCRIATIDPDGSGLEIAEWTLQSTARCDARTHAHLRPG